MSVYTFSTRTKRPEDTLMVDKIKEECDKQGLNFSSLVIKLLREHDERKIQDSKQTS